MENTVITYFGPRKTFKINFIFTFVLDTLYQVTMLRFQGNANRLYNNKSNTSAIKFMLFLWTP